jgi:hypothetical protein
MAHPARNFRLDDETWEAFKAACEGDGSKAATELTRFVRAYIAGHRIDQGVAECVDVDARIKAEIAPIWERLDAMEFPSVPATKRRFV